MSRVSISKKKKKISKSLRYQLHLNVIWRRLFAPIFIHFFRLSTDTKFISYYKTPYVLLCNHTSVIDPFVFHTFTYKQLHFIVSDAHFRNPFMRAFLGLGGSIPKKKEQTDLQTIQKIIYVAKKKREPICIFAEGVNTWDGTSQKIVEGTASLLSYLKLPVVCAHAHGAYLTRPRWGHQIRRGKIKAVFKLCITAQEIHTLTKSKIAKRIKDALYYNEFEKQKANPIAFVSPTRAEYVERVLFACPYCHQIQCIHSSTCYFHCTNCLHKWYMDLQGFFHTTHSISAGKSERQHPPQSVDKHIASWNTWQQNFLITYINNKRNNEIIFYDDNCVLRYGINRPLVCGIGRISLTRNHLYFMPHAVSRNTTTRQFSLAIMNAVNVQNNEKLEWSTGKLFYQIKPDNPRCNTYKYMRAITYLQSLQHGVHNA